MKTVLKYFFGLALFFSQSNWALSQNLSVEGKVAIQTLPLDNSATQVLILLNNDTIGIRDISTITGGGGGSPFITGGAASNNGFDNGINNFMPMGSGTVRSDIIANVDTRVPMDGILSKFEGGINGATIGTDYTFTVFKNGSATGLTCTVSTGSVTCNDLVNSVQFCEGDRIAVNFLGNDDGTNSDNRVGRWVGLFTPSDCP